MSYTYDEKGNISTISEGGTLKIGYIYDNLSQLVRENNVYLNKTITYGYDVGGNITEKKEYAYTTQADLSGLTPTQTIAYGYTDAIWKDKLITYGGNTISYDAIGNPLTYYDGRTFTWQNGRQLASTAKSGVTCSYKYDDSGIRTQKTVGSVTTDYYLNGGQVEAETNGTDTLRYFYDENGDLIGFNLTNATYPAGANFYYYRNGQNDIIGILNATGISVVSYGYDSWGKLVSTTGTLATTVGVINPYRYRGYRYDTETGLYYLQSRYYDPTTGRFVNADEMLSGVGSVLGYNMFSYCLNNPVNMRDVSGHWPTWNDIKNAIKSIADSVKSYVTGIVNGFVNDYNSLSLASMHETNRRPNTGEPGSTYKSPNGDTRTYGPDGKPQTDYDHDDHGQPGKHPHDEDGGHNHDWDGPNRGPAYAYDVIEPILGGVIIVGCVVLMVVVAIDDTTGVGIADDFLFGPLSCGVGEGFVMIFGR